MYVFISIDMFKNDFKQPQRAGFNCAMFHVAKNLFTDAHTQFVEVSDP